MKPLSNVLLALMYFAKSEWPKMRDENLSWTHVRSALKNADYDQADHMRLGDVLDFITRAYEEALSRPDLKIHGSLGSVMKAPFAGHFAVEWPHWNMKLTSEYPLEKFYNAMFAQMISDIQLTSVNKCEQYLNYADKRDHENDTLVEDRSACPALPEGQQ